VKPETRNLEPSFPKVRGGRREAHAAAELLAVRADVLERVGAVVLREGRTRAAAEEQREEGEEKSEGEEWLHATGARVNELIRRFRRFAQIFGTGRGNVFSTNLDLRKSA
jgi:hypothetical protein